jgi:hypothetical protein
MRRITRLGGALAAIGLAAVIRQSPTAGITASRGSAVNLTEATPPKPHGCSQ